MTTAFAIALLAASFSSTLNAQRSINSSLADEQTAADLIQFLRYQSGDRLGRPISFTCGLFNTDRAAVKSLVALGTPALPAIQSVLDPLDQNADNREFVGIGLLLQAYAGILRHDAFGRLRRMADNPKLEPLLYDLDDAIAMSLDLTSYVSSSKPLRKRLDCNRATEPRHALNQLLLAWLRNDRQWLAAALGPNASAELRLLTEQGGWASFRSRLWGERSRDTAVGYRIADAGRWSEPEETFKDVSEGRAPIGRDRLEFETMFTNAAGGECGSQKLTFIKPDVGTTGELPYLIETSKLRELLSLIASCALTPAQ